MKTKPTPAPVRISPIHAQGMYLNDGAIVISRPTEDGGSEPVLHVLTTTQPRRGQGHIHADPGRDDHAEFVVLAWNSHAAMLEILEKWDAFMRANYKPADISWWADHVAALKLAKGDK